MKESKKSQQKTNIRTVAEQVGVSAMTVSRALSGSPLVKPETRTRIIRQIRDMGYDYEAKSRILQNERKKNIAIHVDIIKRETGFYDFHMQLYFFCISALKGAGLTGHTVDLNHNFDEELPSLADCGGLIVQSQLRPEVWEKLRVACPNLKVVNVLGEVSGVPGVTPDEVGGGEAIARYLTDLGHTHVAVFMAPWEKGFRQRYAGLAAEFCCRRPEARVDRIEFADPSDREEADRMRAAALDRYFADCGGKLPTAFVTVNSYDGVFLFNYLKKRGLRVPEDIGLTGYDRIDYQLLCGRNISHAYFELKDLAFQARRLLTAVMEQSEQPVFSLQIPVNFSDGGSVLPVEQMHRQ